MVLIWPEPRRDKEFEERTMKKISVYVFAFVIAGAASAIFATVALHRSHVVLGDVNTQTDAAFRDGLFLARLDAEHGRKPRLLSGRWSTEGGTRSFALSYFQGYTEYPSV